MCKFVIRKNIPIPSPTPPSKYPLKNLKVGESFYVKNADPHIFYVYGKRLGRKFVTRSQGVGTRVWRVK